MKGGTKLFQDGTNHYTDASKGREKSKKGSGLLGHGQKKGVPKSSNPIDQHG